MGAWSRRLGVVAAGLVGVVGTALGALWWSVWVPPDEEPAPVTCAPDAPTLHPGQSLKVLVWNVQYGGSRQHHFFYDGGRAVSVPAEHVTATLDAVAARILEEKPDIVLLQEVDRGSRRTGYVDQHAELLRRTPFACHASTPYHRAWVPSPGHEMLGRVDMHLSVFSRYRIDDALRQQLALLDEPAWRQAFNLRRALLTVTLPVDGGRPLRLFNTHLSAFSHGDGTLDKQMAALDAAMTRAELAEEPWLLGGDLNALPPGDDPARLGDEAVEYSEVVTPVQRLFDRFSSLVTPKMFAEEPERWRTYQKFGAPGPDRTLDYLFVGRAVQAVGTAVLPDEASDHLPLVTVITLP